MGYNMDFKQLMKPFSNKKGALSLEVVIIAVVCLLVLVVLTVIFATRMGIFSFGLKHCDTLCTSSTDECTNAGYEFGTYYGKCRDIQGNELTEDAYCCKVVQNT